MRRRLWHTDAGDRAGRPGGRRRAPTGPAPVSSGRAFDLIVTGREIDATEAERIGLVARLVSDPELLDEARSLATSIARYTTTALVFTKEAFWHNVDASSLAAAIALENRNQMLASRTPEVQEFMEQYWAQFS